MMQTGRKAEIEIERTVFDHDLSKIAGRHWAVRSEAPSWIRDLRMRFTDESDAERWEPGQVREGIESDFSASRIPIQRF